MMAFPLLSLASVRFLRSAGIGRDSWRLCLLKICKMIPKEGTLCHIRLKKFTGEKEREESF